jgi:hypothetical protein
VCTWRGSAACVDEGECAVVFDDPEQLLTWELGDLRNQSRSVDFVLTFPQLDDQAAVTPGLYSATLGNVAAVGWADRAGDHEIGSNEVVLGAEAEVLGVEEEREREPEPKPEAKPRPPAILPATGAPANAGLRAVLDGLLVVFGAVLMLRRRREAS